MLVLAKHEKEFTVKLILTLLAALSLPAAAQVYKWTDADGNTHFGSQPPAGQRDEVRTKDTRPSGSGPAVTMAPERKAALEGKTSPAEKLRSLERVAEKRACDLTRTELSAAQRKLTLALSIDQRGPMADYRRNQVDLWQRRARIECLTDY